MEDQVGSDVDIGALIMRGVSTKLKSALTQVESQYGHFKYGSINPRPMKKDGFGYRLGSLSEHALGNAIDINAKENPQIREKWWTQIVAYVNQPMSQAGRSALWKTNPRGLYDYMKKVSDTFAKKVEEAVAAKVKGPPAVDDKAALAAVVGHNAHLTAIGLEFVRKHRGGFFTLPWELIKDLHEAQFVWGATFSTVDIHHFDFGSQPRP
jgi:hypothetical protein